jgi:hypothetical protein
VVYPRYAHPQVGRPLGRSGHGLNQPLRLEGDRELRSNFGLLTLIVLRGVGQQRCCVLPIGLAPAAFGGDMIKVRASVSVAMVPPRLSAIGGVSLRGQGMENG